MPDSNQGQLTIWGRANSVNVQKVLWCLRELDLAYRAHRCRHGVRPQQRARLSRDESQRARADAGGRRFRAVGIQFDHALSRARLSARDRRSIRRRRNGAPASTAGWTGRFRRCSRSIVRCSGRWCAPRSNSATWSRSRRMPTPRPCEWRIVDAQLATRRFIEGDDFTLADIALGAYARRWFGVEGITKPQLPHLERWFAQFSGPAGISGNSSRRRCREGARLELRSKARTLEQQDARRSAASVTAVTDQARGPGHAAADPPQHRATHHDGNDDIESQRACPLSPLSVADEPPTPMLTAPPIFTQVSVPSTLTKPGP